MQILKHNPTVVVTPEVLAVYRLTTNSMCSNIPGMWCGFQKAILKQQSLFKRNQLIQRILHKKLLEMKQVYLKSQWRYVVKRYDKEYILYQKHMPWPLQKMFVRLLRVSFFANIAFWLIKH